MIRYLTRCFQTWAKKYRVLFPVFGSLCNIHAFAATHIDNEIFSSFRLLLGSRRIKFLVHPQRIHRRFQCLQRKHSPPFFSCVPRNTCGLLSNLSRGTDNGCSVAPSMTSGWSNETPPIFFSSSSKPPSLANVLVVTIVVSTDFVSSALGIFSEPFGSLRHVARVSSVQG